MKHRPKRLRWKEYDYGVTNPGLFRVSDRMLQRMRPDLFGFRVWFQQTYSRLTGRWTVRDFFREQLWLGSIQAATTTKIASTTARRRELAEEQLALRPDMWRSGTPVP